MGFFEVSGLMEAAATARPPPGLARRPDPGGRARGRDRPVRGARRARARPHRRARRRSSPSSAPCCGPGEIELHLRNDGADPVQIEQAIVNDGFASFTQTNDEIGRLGGAEVKVELPLDRGRELRGDAAHLDRRDDRPRDRRGRRDPGRRPRLLRPDGADRPLRRRDPGGDRHALAALAAHASTPRWIRFLLAFTVGLLALPRRSRRCSRARSSPARAPAGARRRARSSGSAPRAPTWRWRAWTPGCADARSGPARDEAGADAAPRSASAPPCSSRSASACTTSARGSRSARPTRSARSRSGAALVVGFALHNTTEGLAIVAPVARSGTRAAAHAGPARPARRRARRARRLDRRLGLPPERRRAHVRHRRRGDRPGDRPDRAGDSRRRRPRCSTRWRPAGC